MTKPERDRVHLQEMLDLIDMTIAQVSVKGKAAFLADLNLKDATALRVQVIGEYMRSLSDEFRERHPDLPWRQSIGMRNIVAHEYGRLDYEILWEVVSGQDFAQFREHIQTILKTAV